MSVKEERATEYRTRDIYRAVWLESQGYACRRIETLRPGVGVFVFQLAPEVETALDAYETPEATCNVHDFIAALRRLKGRLFEAVGSD